MVFKKKYFFILIFLLLNTATTLLAQLDNYNFLAYQKTFTKVNIAYNNIYDSMQQYCNAKGITWPIQKVYLRAFKYENQIECWVKDGIKPNYQLYKTYTVCGTNGKLGPKRKQGDKQVPEGFYYINQFNPNSNYHLSLGINYPNISDKILADAVNPGGEIFIHGDCVSIGCLAINNQQIEDLYLVCATARNYGQEYIPVHIFPGRFTNNNCKQALQPFMVDNKAYTSVLQNMQWAFYYFDKSKQIPPVLVNNKGEYIVPEVVIPKTITLTASPVIKNINRHKQRSYADGEIESMVDKLPQYEGGIGNYASFLSKLNTELQAYLTAEVPKVFLHAEFIVNKDGTVSNVTIIRGGLDPMHELVINRFENTKNWQPAIKNNVSVAYKMTQSIFVDKALVK